MSSLPAVEYFCLYVTTAILFDFFLQACVDKWRWPWRSVSGASRVVIPFVGPLGSRWLTQECLLAFTHHPRSSGGRGGRSGGSGGVEESKGSSSGGADGGGGGDYKFPGRCFRCGHRGHQAIGCTTNEKDFVPWCARSEGCGHTKEKCATEEAVLAQVVEHESDVDSVEDQAFCAVAVPPGEFGTVGEVGLVGVLEQGQAVYVADTSATCSMFRCADNFVNYRERSGLVKGIGGDKAPVPLLGYGDVTLVLQTEDGGVPVPVLNAAHVPEAPYNLLSLSSLAEEGHT
ncbi:unnamed protein product [Ectocarpus sp. CCAP 1310/34]|nr:unnamed protein product [Ectocarpus sp. CCAP 1310/34]